MVKTRSQDGDSKGKELDVESRLSRLEDMLAERSKMMKQLADMVEAFSRSTAGKSEFPRFEDDCDDDQPPNGEFGESIEHRMVNLVLEAQEENPKLENHEGWEQIGILEVEGDVERDQKMISNAKTFCAHKVFDKMSQHQESLGIKKKKKGLKSWMFKYKKGNKKRDLLLLNGKDSLALRAIGTGLETVERDSSNQEKSKLCTEDKGELKGCLERLQASVLLKEESESMVVNEVKAEFKTFDKKSSNKTLSLEDEQDDEHEQNQELLDTSQKMQTRLVYHEEKNGLRVVEAGINKSFMTLDRKRSDRTLSLEDKQDDEHEQNQVIKLISSLKTRIWEPGGVLIEHDSVKETVVELMQKLGETGLIMKFPSKVKDALDGLVKVGFKLQVCSGFDLETWIGLEVYGWEYKKQISIGHINLYGMCNELAYDKDKKKERNIEDDVKKEKNRFLREGKIILAFGCERIYDG